MFPFFINPFVILLSLSTAAGVFVHDTHIDKAAATAMANHGITANYDTPMKQAPISPELHTHSERSSFAQAAHDLKSPSPSVAPRGGEDKKHLMQKRVARGHHAFDNYNLPIV